MCLFPFSRGGLPRGKRVWRQPRNQRRSGTSTETAQNLSEEGLLQDPRCRQVTSPTSFSPNKTFCAGIKRQIEQNTPTNIEELLLFFFSGMQISRRSSRRTGSWHSSGTRTTSSPRLRRRKRKRSLSTSRRLKRSSPTQVRSWDFCSLSFFTGNLSEVLRMTRYQKTAASARIKPVSEKG